MDGKDHLAAPLLGKKAPPPLTPLYAVSLLRTTAVAIAMIPAFNLRVSALGQAAGYDAAEVANALGLISALRSFSEFTAAPMLASWSDRHGRKWALLLSSVAFVLEAALIAVSPGLLMMGIVHTLGGFLASNGAIETSCVADATPAGPKRAVAVGRFLTVVGAALVLGPFLGGILLENFGGRSPFAFAAVLGFIALLAMTGFVPEYLPPSRRSQSSSTTKAPVLAAFQLLVQNPALRWYTAASGLFSLGMAVYGTVNVLWLKEAFGWNGQDVGHFLSAVGAAVIISQVVFLPVLLRIAKGREPWVVQGAIVLHAIKFVGYAWAPRGPWAYVVLAISSPTFCAAPILSSLCTRHVPSTQQGLWSGSASALSTAANVVGALIGSRLLAIALEGHLPLGSPLYAGTVFHLLAALCVGCGCRVAGEKKVDEVTEGFPDPICGA
ncbi:unnamed protein product [Cladocopium goreaui]|uniref:Tetracycline resistance protein, class B n=1 Tax=Cladocopium goreaui TaxID=2562237 RepID=A0A9P1FGG0_9DINO|nr:unnamed protein product [Cladocopium goreaui]